MENWTIATIWERLSGKKAPADAYPEGYVSHRKDGDYKKDGREWKKIPGSEGTAPEEMAHNTHFTIKKPYPVLMGGSEAKEKWHLITGDELTDKEQIAEGHGIHHIEAIKEKAARVFGIKGTNTTDWKKNKGIAQVSNDSRTFTLEIHWYEIKGHGKIFFKEKFED